MNCFGAEVLHDNGASERARQRPARRLFIPGGLCNLAPAIHARAGTPRAGWGRAPLPAAGSVTKFASSPSLRESLSFHSGLRVLGETAGLQTRLAHTGTRDGLFKHHHKGTSAPEARPGGARGRAPADRKELINPALMTPSPSPVGSVLPAPVIEK